MQALKGKHIYLRALEPEDIDFLFTTENDTSFWEISSTHAPFSRFLLEQYITNSHQDIYTAKQLRLIIAKNTSDQAVGMIDLFDFNPQHHRAGIGILITSENQKKGFASEALSILIDYCFKTLNLHQLFANISSDNKTSLELFKKFNFKEVGLKKDWIYINSTFKDEFLFQLIKQ
jgi:diamine N-acetyltransferase